MVQQKCGFEQGYYCSGKRKGCMLNEGLLLGPGHEESSYQGKNDVGKPDAEEDRNGLPGGENDRKPGEKDVKSADANTEGKVKTDTAPDLAGGNRNADKR